MITLTPYEAGICADAVRSQLNLMVKMNESLAKQLHNLVDKHKLIVDNQVNESIVNLKEDLRKVFEIDLQEPNQETPNNT